MRKIFVCIALSFSIVFFACEKDNDAAQEIQHDVAAVTGANTGTVNKAVALTVTYPYSNGCDFVERFTESRASNIVTIKAITKPVDKEAICTQDAGTRTIVYTFTSSVAGTFTLKFQRLDGSTVDHSITIQ